MSASVFYNKGAEKPLVCLWLLLGDPGDIVYCHIYIYIVSNDDTRSGGEKGTSHTEGARESEVRVMPASRWCRWPCLSLKPPLNRDIYLFKHPGTGDLICPFINCQKFKTGWIDSAGLLEASFSWQLFCPLQNPKTEKYWWKFDGNKNSTRQ